MEGPWKIRFETKGKEYLEFIKTVSNEVEKCIWYFHPIGKKSEKPHIHGLIINYPKIDDTMRNMIKNEFDLDGRKQEFSVSNKYDKIVMTNETYPGYITYMTKGKFEPVFSKGFDKEEIEKLKNEWIDYEHKTVMNIEVHKTVKLKITRFALAQQVLAEYTESGIPEEWDREEDKNLLKKCVNICNLNSVLPHYRAVAEIAQAVKLNMEPSSKSAYRKCLNMV